MRVAVLKSGLLRCGRIVHGEEGVDGCDDFERNSFGCEDRKEEH